MTPHDDYWTYEVPIGQGTFRYFHSEKREVQAQIHLSQERYSPRLVHPESVPISILAGTRTYLHMKFSVFTPDIRLIVALALQPDQRGRIGQVIGQEARPPRRLEIGNAQAWYYPSDRLLLLWECFFQQGFRDAPLLEDANMLLLWQGVEGWLVQHFPEATRRASPFREPIFNDRDYQAFLRALGYAPVAQAAFGKPIPTEGRGQ